MIDPRTISRFRKEKFIREKSEDDFRDGVVRPLFLRTGLEDGRDCCGIHEEGKDCFFIKIDELGHKVLYVVQTKKGNINLASEASKNLLTIITQLKTALETRVYLAATKEKIYPAFAVLCASGKINDSARKHIVDEVKDPRIRFQDINDLIPLIDKHYHELWFGLDVNKIPYFKKLKELLSCISNDFVLSDLITVDSKLTTVTDEMYVPLRLLFTTYRIKRFKGQAERVPKIEDIPLEGILKRRETLFLILGEAGAGKSTALKRLAFMLCNQSLSEGRSLMIPILLRAVDIAAQNIRLIDICINSSQQISLTKNPCFSAEDLNKGNVLILIDALDEIANRDKREKVLNDVKAFSCEYPKCKVIITSREHTYLKELQELSQYEVFRITKINIQQAKKMVEKLIKGKTLPKEAAQEMVRRLQDVHGLDLTPLLVTVFVATSDYSRKDIPANITELFKKYTEWMLGRWDHNKGLSQQFQAPLKDFLLKKLAYQMHSKGTVSLSINECIEIFKHELEIRGQKAEDIESLVNEILYRSGLFRILEDKIEFRHLLLQEFFAGRGISSADLIPMLIKDQWWQRAIIFYFGENPADSKSLENIIDNISTTTPQEKFQVAVTVGLSMQACYLVEMTKKIDLLKWVLEKLSIAKKDLLSAEVGQIRKYPLTSFILYYLFGRDAVAVDVLENENNVLRIIEDLRSKNKDKEEEEATIFWLIVGLIERGNLKGAEQLIESFTPKDIRLLLALHLGCFYVENLRIATQPQRDIANRICSKIAPKISHLRSQLLTEFTSELLEMQRGEIKAIK